jgi:hypothetical protein
MDEIKTPEEGLMANNPEKPSKRRRNVCSLRNGKRVGNSLKSGFDNSRRLIF